MTKQYEYPRITEEEYRHALGQFRLQLNDVFRPFRCYGLEVFVDGAMAEVIHLAEAFGMRIRGKEEPIQVRFPAPPRPTD